MGHEGKPIPPIYVEPYVKRSENDKAGAAAIGEAMARPGMRFVAVKSAKDRAAPVSPRTRDPPMKRQAMNVHSPRGRLSESGIPSAKGAGHVEEPIEKAESGATLPEPVEAAGKVFGALLETIEARIVKLGEQIARAHGQAGSWTK